MPALAKSARERVVVIAGPWQEWRWFEAQFPEIEWLFVYDNPTELEERLGIARGRSCLRAVTLAKQAGARLIIAHGPSPAGWAAALARTLGVNVPVLAFTFNFTALPTGIKRRAAASMLAGVERFVVFSAMERQLYADTFGIPRSRIDMVHWAVKPPEVSEGREEDGDYVCAIGGNARDYATLLQAADQVPEIPFVLVVRPESLQGLWVPPNVRVRVNLELARTMNVLQHSRFMVLPLAGAEVPCGHVTMVAAMHLGRTFVVTNSSGVADYALDGVNCVSCPAFDAPALASAIRGLWGDPERIATMERNAKQFAQQYCAEPVAIEHLRGVLRSYGLALPVVDSTLPQRESRTSVAQEA